MQLTVAAFEQLLQQSFSLTRQGAYDPAAVITGLRIGPGEPGILGLSADPGAAGPFTLTLCSRIPQAPGWYLLCPEEAVTEEMNQILALYFRYLQWHDRIVASAAVEQDLDALVDCAAEFLRIDLLIHDANYHTVCDRCCSGLAWQTSGELDFSMGLPTVEALYVLDPEFDKTFQAMGLSYFPHFPREHGCYYYNVNSGGNQLARILLVIPREQVGPGFLALAEFVCQQMAACYLRLYEYRDAIGRRSHLRRIWKALLAGEAADHSQGLRMLQAAGWQRNHTYQMLCLRSAGYAHSGQTLQYYAGQFEASFPGTLAAELEGSLVCLCNLTLSGGDFHQELSCFLRENLFKAGESNQFCDFFDCPRYCRQAAEAYALGEQTRPSFWRYSFSAHLYEYLQRKLTEDYPAGDLCPLSVQRLQRYDQAHPEAQLTETLRQYIACRFNATQAAQRLFIHRTTFFYRMNKLQQIASIQLEDWKELLCLMAYFSLEEK